MTQVERVARELHEVDRAEAATLGGRCTDQQHWREFLALARHVLRRERAAVRRARGRTLGTVCVSKAGFMCGNRVHRKDEKPWSVSTYRPARVVAVPKPRKGGRE